MKTHSGIINACLLTGLSFLSTISSISAQDNVPAILNLEQCIDQAINNSYQLNADSMLFQSLQMAYRQEQSAYYPQISAGLGLSGRFLSPYTFGQHYLQAVADWDIGRFLKKTADIRQMESLQQEISAFQDSLEITGVVTGLYFDVLQAQLEIQILQTRLAYLNKHLEILQVLWKAGTIQKLDILQTRSIINKANEDIMQKELIDKQLKYAMSRIMGFSSTDEFAVDTLSMVLPPPGIIDQVPDTWLENHPQVRGFQNLYEKELLMKNEVRAAYLPHIQVISGYTLDGDPTGDGDYTLLSIGATIPVFSWERKDYQLGEIDYNAKAIQEQKKNTERDLNTSFDQVAAQIQQINKIIEFQETKLQNDLEAANMSESNYLSGIATNLDFLTAQQKLTETRLNINTLRYQYLKSVMALWLLTGQVDEIKNIK